MVYCSWKGFSLLLLPGPSACTPITKRQALQGSPGKFWSVSPPSPGHWKLQTQAGQTALTGSLGCIHSCPSHATIQL